MSEQSHDHHGILRKFLAIREFELFFSALHAAISHQRKPSVNRTTVLFAIAIALLPLLISLLSSYTEQSGFRDLPAIVVGIAALFGILVRARHGFGALVSMPRKRAIKLTHIGFALGCIPAVIVLVYFPELLAERKEAFAQAATASPKSYLQKVIAISSFILLVSLWAAATEELIFRGMLVSTIRRWEGIKNHLLRDCVAVLLSAMLFGAAHVATWGLGAALVLTGIGIGFALGYIANGERLGITIFYHFVFDVLSISVALLA
ncbi:CPBP family intramembrane metalloprotease [bacterium]|nr:CPBP family intramembrane metalloprotease [bacterium]